MSHSVTKTAALMIGGLFFLSSCKEDTTSSNEPVEIWGGRLDGLAEAYGAPALDLKDRGLVEVLLLGESWKSYDRGRFHASSPDLDQLLESIDELRDRCVLEGFEPRLVVSAPAGTPFLEIREVVRCGAKVGYGDVEFLVDQCSSRASALPLSLTIGMGCESPPDIEPVVVVVNADQKVSIGTGPARQVLDRDKTDRTLPGLDERLRSYARAAEVTASVPSISLFVDSSAPYQRMVDVLACVEWNGIGRIHFIDLEDRWEPGCGGLLVPKVRLETVAKPRAPWESQMKPLGLAPHENQLPKPPFDPELD